MAEITLEKMDIIRERTGVSYSEAKEALEACQGNVVDALVYLENKQKENNDTFAEDMYTTKDEFKKWLKDLINKGNITRIKVKKDDKVLIDIPVNAGIAAGMFAFIWPQLLGIGIITAVVTRITVEITKSDGSVEVVNTIIKNAVDEMKNKVTDFKDDVEQKVNKKDEKGKEENFYQYSVKFDDVEENNAEENNTEENNTEENNTEEKDESKSDSNNE
jgi:uncharacterized protein DUF4342